MKKSSLIAIAFLLLNTVAFSQSGKLNRANKHFEKENYEKAIVLYQKAFEKEEEKDRDKNYSSKLNAIHAAIQTENYKDAEYWLGHVVVMENTSSKYRLYYAACLMLNQKCDLGKWSLMKYQKVGTNDEGVAYLKAFINRGACREKNPEFDWRKIIID